jgi:hypothetical protein
MTDIDLLDQVLNLESEFYHEGRAEGEQKGAQEGHVEGYNFGVAKGRQIGEELGHISGLVEYLLHVHEKGDSKIPWTDRLVKNLESLRDLLTQFPYDRPNDDEYNTQLENIRAKYKLLDIRLGIIVKKMHGEESTPKQTNDSLAF